MQYDVTEYFNKYKIIADKLSYRYKNYSSYEDIKQSAYESLILAIKSYDEEKAKNIKSSDPFKCYCYTFVKRAVLSAYKKERVMSLNSNNYLLRKLALDCKYELMQKNSREPLMFEVVNEVSKIVKEKYTKSNIGNVTECRLIDVMERNCSTNVFYEDPYYSNLDCASEENVTEDRRKFSSMRLDYVARINSFGRESYVERENFSQVVDVLKGLNERDTKILKLLMKGNKQEDIAKELGLTQASISYRKSYIINEIYKAYSN